MVMWAAMSFAGSWPRAPQLFPTPSWFMPNLGEKMSALPGAERPARPLPSFPLRPLASRVANLMGDGERCGQADVLINAATSLSLAHPAHGGQAWEMGTWWGVLGAQGCVGWPLYTLPGPRPCQGRGQPAHCLQGSSKPMGRDYLACHKVCSCRCRCRSCGRSGGS